MYLRAAAQLRLAVPRRARRPSPTATRRSAPTTSCRRSRGARYTGGLWVGQVPQDLHLPAARPTRARARIAPGGRGDLRGRALRRPRADGDDAARAGRRGVTGTRWSLAGPHRGRHGGRPRARARLRARARGGRRRGRAGGAHGERDRRRGGGDPRGRRARAGRGRRRHRRGPGRRDRPATPRAAATLASSNCGGHQRPRPDRELRARRLGHALRRQRARDVPGLPGVRRRRCCSAARRARSSTSPRRWGRSATPAAPPTARRKHAVEGLTKALGVEWAPARHPRQRRRPDVRR